MELTDLRDKIDQIDARLVSLFAERMETSSLIADYKRTNSLPIHIPKREQEVLDKVTALSGPELADYTRQLYILLFKLSREYQAARNTKTTQ